MKTELMPEEFIRNADPIPDDTHDTHPMARLWKGYMVEAMLAHKQAHRALKENKDKAAYWNALHAVGSYAAAHAAVTKDNKIDATAEATYAYLAGIANAKAQHPHLYKKYGHLLSHGNNTTKSAFAKKPLPEPKPLREEEQLYDFCLSDDLNEKLKTAINLLNEVDAELCEEKEDYLEDFLYELKQGTHRLVTAIRGLDQDPIV